MAQTVYEKGNQLLDGEESFYMDLANLHHSTANYQEAVKLLRGGVDDTNSRLWWDVEPNWEGVLSAEDCVPSVVIPADWQVVTTGNVVYGLQYYGDTTPLYEGHAATMYEDVNHPGTFKISPWGGGEMIFTDDGAGEYVVDNQLIGTLDGKAINIADWNVDQNIPSGNPVETEICYFDEDEQAYLFLLIYRIGGPRGASEGIGAYGYDGFYPDGD